MGKCLLFAKISTGDPSGSNHGQPLNCQAGPCTNTATTRSLGRGDEKGGKKKDTEHFHYSHFSNTTNEAIHILSNTFSPSRTFSQINNFIYCPGTQFCYCVCSSSSGLTIKSYHGVCYDLHVKPLTRRVTELIESQDSGSQTL